MAAMRTETEYFYGHETFGCIMRVWVSYWPTEQQVRWRGIDHL